MKPSMPPTPCQFLLLGVPDGYFQHQLWRNLEELGVVAVGLEQEWQDIEAASWGFPALLCADLQPEVVRSCHRHCCCAPDPPDTMAVGGGAEIPMQASKQHLPLELPEGKSQICCIYNTLEHRVWHVLGTRSGTVCFGHPEI